MYVFCVSKRCINHNKKDVQNDTHSRVLNILLSISDKKNQVEERLPPQYSKILQKKEKTRKSLICKAFCRVQACINVCKLVHAVSRGSTVQEARDS